MSLVRKIGALVNTNQEAQEGQAETGTQTETESGSKTETQVEEGDGEIAKAQASLAMERLNLSTTSAANEQAVLLARTVPKALKLPGRDLVGGGTSTITNQGSSSGSQGGSASGSSAGSGTSSGSGSSSGSQSSGSSNASTTPHKNQPVQTGDLSRVYPFGISLSVAALLCGFFWRMLMESRRRRRDAIYREEWEKFHEDCKKNL